MSKRLTKEIFVEKCKILHGNKYNYNLLIYKRSIDKVKIICPEHGVFEQRGADHIRGQGCRKCLDEKTGNRCRSNTEEFTKKATLKHGEYSYELVNYVNAHVKVKIICSIHGVFEQTPKHHLSGHKCLYCNVCRNNLEPKLLNKLKLSFPEVEINQQISFEWLKLKTAPQSIDIYFPQHSIAIEYQGKQHFHPIEFFGGENRFKDNVIRDERKRILCQENGVKLFYFTYKPKDVPDDYPHKIYTCENELIKQIKKIINKL